MENVFAICRSERVFTLQEAQAMLPVVLRITADAQRKVSLLMNRMQAIKYGSTEAASQLEDQVQAIIDQWHKKMTSLGGYPKGAWIADFDFGKGYYCWKYPENQIRYYHGYKEGFAGRKEIFPEA